MIGWLSSAEIRKILSKKYKIMAEKTTQQNNVPQQSDAQILAAIQEVLLNARISNLSGTEVQWTTANPVLKRAEIGFVTGSLPVKFKVGDGVTAWSALGWGNATTLAQLAEDPSHRLVTDTEKAGWNAKINSYIFSFDLYNSGTTAQRAEQAEIAKNIVFASASQHPLVVVQGATPGSSGLVALRSITSTRVEGVILDISASSMTGNSITLFANTVTFNSEGQASLSNSVKTPGLLTSGAVANDLTTADATKVLSAAQGKVLNDKITNIKVPEYSLAKVTSEPGFASSYHLQKDGEKVGDSINIPLDRVLKSATIKTATKPDVPYAGAKVGDKYIEFLFQNTPAPQYLPVQDLVDTYTGADPYIAVLDHEIHLQIYAVKSRLQSDFEEVFDPFGAAQAAVDAFAKKEFVIKCSIPGLE